ncbi:calcium-binding protein [bacterium]|nr:MAG: calcium-binding protein [bacterium]
METTLAKIIYGNALGPGKVIASQYAGTGTFIEMGTTSATFQEPDGDRILLEGKQLKFEDGVLVSGTLTKVEFSDFEHANYGTMTGDMKASAFNVAYGDMDALLERLSAGNDRIIGTDNSDYLEGYKGNDTIKGGAGRDIIWAGRGDDNLFGGEGADYFSFYAIGTKSEGDDRIYDFDAVGGGNEQDYISCEAEPISIHKNGKNVIIDFEDGASITLIDVKRSDISLQDFASPDPF